ncbi:MAG: MFS transporter [Bacilli bacterium]|nr:MFS transporter [Bacilli bacterium]
MKKLFSNKSFILLFAGNLVSEIGNSLFSIALSFYILDLSNSGLAMGAFLFVAMGSRILVSPLAGVLVDRWNRVRVIYVTDFIRGIVFVLLLLYIMSNPSTTQIIVSLYVIGIISNISAAFFGPAMTSALPEIVGEDNLQAANGANSIVGSVQNIVGVLAGAAIYYYVGIEWVILLNAISFGLSGFSEMFIKAKYRVEKTKEELEIQKSKSKTQDFKESLVYIKNRTGLLNLVFYSLILNFAFSPLFALGLPYLFNTDLARVNAEMEYAYSNIAFSIAMLVAGLTVGAMKITSIHHTLQRGLLFLSGSFAVVALLMFLVSNGFISFNVFYVSFIIGMMLIAASMMLTNVPLNTGMVKVIDPEYRGRVFSTIGAISGGAVPVSFLIGGFILEYLNVSFLGLFCVLVLLYPTFGFITNHKVKGLLLSIDKHNEDNGRLQEAI